MMRRHAVIAGAVLALVTIAAGIRAASDPLPRATPASVGIGPEALSASTAVLQRAVDDHRIAGAVAMLARNGRLAHVATIGYQDLSTRTPMSDRTMFRIYSMTKPI